MGETSPGGATVLIVDDLARVREGLRSVLELEGDLAIAGEAADGLQAVSMARELRPDIVLMDLEMPALDGFEATRQIKQHGLAKGVIVLSIHSDGRSVTRAASAGADAFIEKGTSVQDLIDAIHGVLQTTICTSRMPSPPGKPLGLGEDNSPN